ncbi:hypothetical protein CONCODRAFT_79246 [Conidiobolus coronatus NRRL 28638]|uniref:Methylated-DNA--protein-cysteine methyltransferase n=1 Tax=Conidiobolus coronatus (strain ATCC 28846 / CBS 209.66 / NRRL 28638) TaxID=796925 RepID=A0A137P3L8_CONC2|nr:hypothetical protein CONCODRAFT_79246 [Conidiobolus coronatus NRRL 28638]|eukprot:KXN69615.1 hypothetical protein CONCODRAFT_79246 [Conidiobolus coronatus NRRL 28638]
MTATFKEYKIEIPEGYINPKNNRSVTEFQKRVYECCAQIPEGYYSTYGAISKALNSSPRAALRLNPFSPLPVPCHRVLSSTGFIGGYSGQWAEGDLIDKKYALLAKEGVPFEVESSYLSEEVQKQKLFTDFKV